MKSNFSLLNERLREYIYEKKWPALKGIQEAAIPAILDTQNNILIAAETASGKTEACFFPIITLILRERVLKKESENEESGIEVLYIGPLKALINDQFERLEPLLHELDIKLWRWHGDVGKTHKKRLLDNPEGILQITPESLEALLLRQGVKIKSLFNRLKFIVIDEVHAFIGTDRGAQLICLLERIQEMGEQALDQAPRRIGLSATLGDFKYALEWLEAGTCKGTILINESKERDAPGRCLSLAVDYFTNSEQFYSSIYEQCRADHNAPSRKCIIFTNSRVEAEEAAAALKKIAARQNEEDHYHVHHGSIAATLKEEAEKNLRETEASQTITATATLELGIDIGRLDRIIQIGAPISVSTFVQRLGRSGRRSGVSQMYFCSMDNQTQQSSLQSGSSALDKIPWTLIKTIAIIELYLEEQWIENIESKPLPLSLLCHQTLSILASLGEHNTEEIINRILKYPPFNNIKENDYYELLDFLEHSGYIEKTEDDTLILGLEAEQIVNHYSFYPVFPDESEFRVTFKGTEIGKINFIPPEDSLLVLGGSSWRVSDLRLNNREICVAPARLSGEDALNETARIWRGGSSLLHTNIVRRMRQVLLEEKHYRYLSASAALRLKQGRDYAAKQNLGKSLFIELEKKLTRNLPFAESAKSSFIFFPWLGSMGMRTLSLVMQNKVIRKDLKLLYMEQINPYAFRIVSDFTSERFRRMLNYQISIIDDPESLLETKRIPYTDKYDYLLPPGLLKKQYAANMLSIEELKSYVKFSN